jgi:hypothetical protein
MRLFAALLSGSGPQPGPKGLGQARAQAGLLEGTLGVAHEAMLKKGFGAKGDQAVFVAPEFWFSNGWVKTDKFYAQDIKRWIVASLARMAKRFPTILLVPGTVLWVKSKKDAQQVSGIEARFKAVNAYHDKTFANLATQNYGQSYNFGWLKKAQTNEPGWSHNIPTQPTGQLPQNPSPVDYLKASDDILIGQNTAYICKGDRILKYHKIGNSAETTDFAKNIVFAPGSIAGQFLVGGVRYGLEICMDHWLGILAESGKAKVDVQVVTSSTTPTRPFHLNMADNAIFVHASNPPLQSGSVYTSGNTQLATYERVRQYPGLSLDLLVAQNSANQTCSPDDALSPVEPQQDGGDLSGPLPPAKNVQALPPR